MGIYGFVFFLSVVCFIFFMILLGNMSILRIILSIEVLFISLSLILIFYSASHQSETGYAFAIIILAMAAIESTMGIILLLNYYYTKSSVITINKCTFINDESE